MARRIKTLALGFCCILMAVAVTWYFFGPRFYVVAHPEVVYIGDSLCEGTHDGQGPALVQIAGVWKDCVGGRSSLQYGALPAGKQIIFYALGANDAMGNIAFGVYRDDLQKKISESDAARIICVMPDSRKKETAVVRQAMQEVCAETIDPREHGYLFSAKDGIHGSVDDHRRYGEWLKGYVDQLLAESHRFSKE